MSDYNINMNSQQVKQAVNTYAIMLENSGIITQQAYNKILTRASKKGAKLRPLLSQLAKINDTWTAVNFQSEASKSQYRTSFFKKKIKKLGFKNILSYGDCQYTDGYTYGLTRYYIFRSFNNQAVGNSFLCIANSLANKLEYPCTLNVALDLNNHTNLYSGSNLTGQSGQFQPNTIQSLGGMPNIVNSMDVYIQNPNQLYLFFQRMAQQRLALKEIYNDENASDYENIEMVRVGVQYYMFEDEEVGDKTKFLLKETLHPNDGDRNECVLRILGQKGITNDSKEVILQKLNKIRPQFVDEDWEKLQEVYNCCYVIFNIHLDVIKVGNIDTAKKLYVVIFNKHAYSFREDVIASSILNKQINFVGLLCKNTDLSKKHIFKQSLLLMPDKRAMLNYIGNSTDKTIHLFNKRTHSSSSWGDGSVPIYIKQNLKNVYTEITEEQFEGLNNTTIDGVKPILAPITETELNAIEPFTMENKIVYDLETMSYLDNKFHTYSAGWVYNENETVKYKSSVVETENDLKNLVFNMTQDWIKMIKRKVDKPQESPYCLRNLIEFTYQRAFKSNYKESSYIFDYYQKKTKLAFIHASKITSWLVDYCVAHQITVVKIPFNKSGLNSATAIRDLVNKNCGNTYEKHYYRTGKTARAMKKFSLVEQSKYLNLPQHYVYSYNGSRFDNLEVIYQVLDNATAREFEITDLIKSSGRIISFNYGPLKFLDLCLLTMSSLKKACSSYGIKTRKGYMPHIYLQHLSSWSEFYSRLNSKNELSCLESYIDWYDETNCEDSEFLQKRGLDKNNKEIPFDKKMCKCNDINSDCDCVKQSFIEKHSLTLKWFNENKNNVYDFKNEMLLYLKDDVMATWNLLEQFGSNTYNDFKLNIVNTPTIGSLATKILKTLLPTEGIPKLLNTTIYNASKKANRGGYSGPIERLYYKADNNKKIYKVDITSLYPSSCDYNPLYEKWWTEFPNPKNGWHYEEPNTEFEMPMLNNKHGLYYIQYDQSHLNTEGKYAPILQNVESPKAKSLTRIGIGEGWYSTSAIRYFKDMGVMINLVKGYYTPFTYNPFKKYMDTFKARKNNADKDKKKELGKPYSERNIDFLNKCEYDRTFSKLMLNSLIGRLNMNAERQQTLLTESYNDCISLMGNPFVECNTPEICETSDGKYFYSMTYKEDDLKYQLGNLDIAPYMSAFVLDYSKILMAENFRKIKELGGTLLYTDTDSVAFVGTPAMYNEYSGQFCLKTNIAEKFAVSQKTFGYMELEGVYDYYCSVGPKKYIVQVDNEYYEYRANGVGAKCNMKVPIQERFEKLIFDKKAIEVNSFSIKCEKGISKLVHTYKGTKMINPLFFKGRIYDTVKVNMWDDELEFYNHTKEFYENRVEYETLYLQTTEYAH